MDLMDYRRKIIANSPHLKSASGAIATFSDGADLPLKSLNVDIEPVQSGSGDPSPTNVRPISGWNAVNVVRAGKNLLPNTAPDTITKSGVTATKNSDGSITLNGTATANVNFEVCGFVNRLMPFTCKGQLTLTGCPAGGSTATYRLVAYLYKDGAYTGTFLNDTGGGSTVDADADHIYAIISVYNGQTYNNLTYYPMIRLASITDATYEPYNGVNVSIDLGQTVYGGPLNPLTGVLTAYPYYASYNGETLTGKWVSDRDKYVAGTTPTIGAQVVDMSGTGTEIQLTPQQIRSLYGNNTIFADTGNVVIEYWAHA